MKDIYLTTEEVREYFYNKDEKWNFIIAYKLIYHSYANKFTRWKLRFYLTIKEFNDLVKNTQIIQKHFRINLMKNE